MIYRPMYVDKIMDYVDTPFVKILTGVRRCGKSTILKKIMEKIKTEFANYIRLGDKNTDLELMYPESKANIKNEY